MLFYFTVQMTFSLKTEPNCTANNPHKYIVNIFPSLLTSASLFHCSFSWQAYNTNRRKCFSFLSNLILFNYLTIKLCLTGIVSLDPLLSRLIIDISLIAFAVFHYMNHNCECKNCFISPKIDHSQGLYINEIINRCVITKQIYHEMSIRILWIESPYLCDSNQLGEITNVDSNHSFILWDSIFIFSQNLHSSQSFIENSLILWCEWKFVRDLDRISL